MRHIRSLIILCAVLFIFTACQKSPQSIPFTVSPNGRILVEAEINGTTGTYMFDTGSYFTISRVPLDSLSSEGPITVNILGGQVTSAKYRLRELTVADRKIRTNAFVLASGEATDSMFERESLDGILGLSVFEGYWLEVHYSDNTLRYGKRKPSGYASSIPAFNNGEGIQIDTLVDGLKTNMLIDTGSPASISLPDAIKYSVQADKKTDILRFKQKDIALVKIDSFTVADTELKDLYAMTDSPYTQVSLTGGKGVLGTSFLCGFDFAIDITESSTKSQTSVLFTHNSESGGPYFIQQEHIDNIASGVFSMRPVDTGLLIDSLLAGSPFHTLGIMPGTIITHINGRKFMDNQALIHPMQVLSPDAGTTFTVTDGTTSRNIVYKF